jgi:hypothetical protein
MCLLVNKNLPGSRVNDLYDGPQTDLLSISGTFTPAVPEPSTWVMMTLGFAGLGFAFRQSRRRALLAY